ncbi:MAG: nuclear transport factor 2 family protein [Dehalococcoidia bacterium]|nr:nuclear transport factor 2 family protein [Dehalococcoidia bacterium]
MSTAENKLEILDLISRYSHAFDGGDIETYTELFAPDGYYSERLGRQEVVCCKGHKELKAYLVGEVAKRGNAQLRHHVRNTIFVQLSGTHAMTRTYFLATVVGREGQLAQVTGTGIFEDEFIKLPKGWRIHKRTTIHDPRSA